MIDWEKIAEFNAEEIGDQEFLVWLPIPPDGAFFVSQWHADLMPTEGGHEGPPAEAGTGEPRFQGEWRHVAEWEDFEPIAFALVNPYEPEGEAHEPASEEGVGKEPASLSEAVAMGEVPAPGMAA